MGQTDEGCPICKAEALREPDRCNHRVTRVECPACGTFAIDRMAELNLPEGPERAKLSAIVRENTLSNGQTLLLYQEQYPKSLPGYAALSTAAAIARFPRLVSERLDRALLNLARLSRHLGDRPGFKQSPRQLLFAMNETEHGFVMKALGAQGMVDFKGRATSEFELTPEGWNRVADLESGRLRSPRNPAFVAMWYGDPRSDTEKPSYMNELYENCIAPAIDEAGYRCDRADLAPHNDFIMDKVMGMIRAAPFIVADFTGNRGGVYFEAGFARGLGIEVTHTCRQSHFDDAHFDIKQVNSIVWDKPEQLGEKLMHRILGTLGRGPFKP